MDISSINPEIETLKLTLWIASGVIAFIITMLVAVISNLISKQIETSEELTIAVTDGTYIYVGERISNTTPTEIARIIKYNASTLAEVGSYSVGANRDVESMVYNSGNNSSSGYISRELTINNNTAPTGAGITAKNSLTNKGWTVLTD